MTSAEHCEKCVVGIKRCICECHTPAYGTEPRPKVAPPIVLGLEERLTFAERARDNAIAQRDEANKRSHNKSKRASAVIGRLKRLMPIGPKNTGLIETFADFVGEIAGSRYQDTAGNRYRLVFDQTGRGRFMLLSEDSWRLLDYCTDAPFPLYPVDTE